MRISATLVALLSVAAPAFAATPAADKPTPAAMSTVDSCLKTQKTDNGDAGHCIGIVAGECMEKPEGQTTYGMMDCQKREIAVWDAKLNATYQALLKGAGPKFKNALKEAQRAWIADRDKTCLLPHAYFDGGTIGGPMAGNCVNEMTAQRFIVLNDYLHFAE